MLWPYGSISTWSSLLELCLSESSTVKQAWFESNSRSGFVKMTLKAASSFISFRKYVKISSSFSIFFSAYSFSMAVYLLSLVQRHGLHVFGFNLSLALRAAVETTSSFSRFALLNTLDVRNDMTLSLVISHINSVPMYRIASVNPPTSPMKSSGV